MAICKIFSVSKSKILCPSHCLGSSEDHACDISVFKITNPNGTFIIMKYPYLLVRNQIINAHPNNVCI